MTGFVTREQWGARPPTGPGNALNDRPDGVAIHWEGTTMGAPPHSECPGIVRGIQDYHMDRQGWSDVAYNLMACRHDVVFEGRGYDHGAAANGSTDANARYYAVCALVGQGDSQPAALHTAVGYAADMCRAWGAGPDVVGHRDLFNTACPGDQLYSLVHAGAFNAGSREDDVMGDVSIVGISDAAAQVVSKAVWERYHPDGDNLATIMDKMQDDVATIRTQLDALIAALTE